jgi:hypothetical protein
MRDAEVTLRNHRIHVFVSVAALALTACATALPPAVLVADIRAVTGTYSGSTKEYGLTPRPTRVTINADNSFEVTSGGPEGSRTTGFIAVAPDRTLGYKIGHTGGRGVVYEGDGRRVIALTTDDSTTTTRVERRLP